ncbi:MAG: HAD-IC family P-type ATPase [Terrimonas sp.]|nr:HAD-IC family P-type ATPase [Terrimonas sp.]
MNWHHLTIEETYERTGSSAAGLKDPEAARRLLVTGPNQLKDAGKKTILSLVINQFKDLMILILLAASIISGFIGDVTDTIVILVIVLLNGGIGFYQEYRAEKALLSLKKIAITLAHVIRDGDLKIIPSTQLVPGDIIVLEAGNAVPADIRIAESFNLRIEEAALTGESNPVEKTSPSLPDASIPLTDRINMAYKGTFVTYGRGKGIVVTTGMATELGHIAGMLMENESQTPLQIRLTAFSKKLSVIILILCLIFFITGWIRGEEPMRMILTSISLAVAAIPEALPAVVTISLALAAKRLVRAHSLVRNLHAVETLGSVAYICTDKTGTLTRNKMSVEEIYIQGEELGKAEIAATLPHRKDLFHLLQFCALNNDAEQNENGEIVGDPTEIALLEIATSNQITPTDSIRLAEIPFDGARKMMTTFHHWQGKFISITKGAPDILITRCVEADSEQIIKALEKIAAKGQRVLGFAWRTWDKIPPVNEPTEIENEMRFAGMVGLMDPPRSEIFDAVKECKEAGIIPIIITGDHPLTAKYIAEKTGILTNDTDLVINGQQFSGLTDENYLSIIERIRVYARVSPEQKFRIIRTLQEKGHFVSMVGDGINDAPSLKKANIGIAMGITGTDVSKEAADLILLDDNFSTIIKAIREGRRVYDNILKFIKYLMTTNSGEIWTLMLAPLAGLPIPLLPIHILWVNLVSDGLPAVSLSFEKAEKGIMKRPPRPTGQTVFAEGRAIHIFWVGMLMAAIVLFIQSWALKNDLHWQTMTFTTLSLTQLAHLLVVRSERDSIFRMGLLSNKVLLIAFVLSFLLQMVVIYVPSLSRIFKTDALSLYELLICLAGALAIILSVETEKWIKRKKHKMFTHD